MKNLENKIMKNKMFWTILFRKIDISISNNYPEKNIYDSQKMLSDKINLYLSLLKTRS